MDGCRHAIALVLLLVTCVAAWPATVFYVAVNGRDDWSGKLPAPNAPRTDGPFASLARARDAVRQLKQAGELTEPVTVALRGGVYYLTETIALGPEDSGTEQCPISYVAYEGERPELVGGRRIELKPGPDGNLTADLPEVRAGEWTFRSLYVDGARQIRARYPNRDETDPYRKGFLYAERDPVGFGLSVGNIHNVGDWMEYDVDVPAGDYTVWVYYGSGMKAFNVEDMGGHTQVTVDGGDPVPLLNLPDTGGWGSFQWSASATVTLAAGAHKLRWQNVKGGGLNLEAFALCDDPTWKPKDTNLPRPAAGRQMVLIQAENFVAKQGRQLSVGGTGSASKNSIHYLPGTFKADWAKAPRAAIHIFQSGSCRAFMEMLTITAVDPQACRVELGGPECVAPLHAGDRYFVENVREELDAPGEWYLDQAAGQLLYRPTKGYTPRSEVVAPVLGRILETRRDAEGNGVKHVRLVGLTFRGTDWSPGDGCVGYGMGNDGTVYLDGASDCAIQGCRFDGIGKYAICLNGGERNTVERCDIHHAGEGGVLLLDSGGNRIADNLITHCGEVYKHIGGVILQGAKASDNVIAHNHVEDISRYGISIKNGGLRNVIEYNRVLRTNLETYDTGGIEVTQHDPNLRSGSTIRYNLVGDAVGYSSNREQPVYLSWGIYLDSYAGGYDVHHNIAYRSSHGGIMFQGGKDNQVTNNIFVDGSQFQGSLSNFRNNSEGLVLERNVFAWTAPEAVMFGHGRLDEKVISIDRNLYCAPGGEPVIGYGGRTTWAQWQEQGFDRNSKLGDPQFMDPLHDDYRLKPTSPAFELGFEAIDPTKIGLLTKRP